MWNEKKMHRFDLSGLIGIKEEPEGKTDRIVLFYDFCYFLS